MKKCEFCDKRTVKQQEWKTEEEKKYCLSCYCFLQWFKMVEGQIELALHEKNIDKKMKITFEKV